MGNCKRIESSLLIAALLMLVMASAAFSQDKIDLRFSFGPASLPGYTKVTPEQAYSAERGYGFDLGSKVKVIDRGGSDPTKSGFVTSVNPKGFFFSVKLPEGAYQVTVTLGDPQGASTTTVKSETRRLMLESFTTSSGEIQTKNFLVHVRRPEFPGGAVAFKDREKLPILYVQWDDQTQVPFTELDWDEKLTLQFSGHQPAVCSVAITNAPEHVTVYLVGDSTMTDQMMEPYAAWGQMFPRWFNSPVLIANYAECGESAASFFGERRWPKLMSEIHPGDYVLIEFGINDRGLSEDRIRQYFGQFIDDTRKKGAFPVLVTSQNLERTEIGNYAQIMRKIAEEQKVPLIDLNALSARLYAAMTPEVLHSRFFIDGTHHSDYGAYELAKCVVQAAIDAKLPWAQHVVADWKPFDPVHPDAVDDFQMPQDPQLDPARKGGPGAPDGRGPMAGAVPSARRGGRSASQPASRPAAR